MRIYLVGFMGCGKTRIGLALARRLGLRFVDLDQEIEGVAGKSVKEIFAQRGEEAFRDLEHRQIQATERWGHAVVATGGGAFTYERNRTVVAQLGTSVWLHPSFATIDARLSPLGRASRPLFQNEAQARALYQSRLGDYRRADHEVLVSPRDNAEQVAAKIALLFARKRSC